MVRKEGKRRKIYRKTDKNVHSAQIFVIFQPHKAPDKPEVIGFYCGPVVVEVSI
jgi:hypothetical protein